MSEPAICAHCNREALGVAGLSIFDGMFYLCHPDYGLDCYRLVTIWHHHTPCQTCEHVRILEDSRGRIAGVPRAYVTPRL